MLKTLTLLQGPMPRVEWISILLHAYSPRSVSDVTQLAAALLLVAALYFMDRGVSYVMLVACKADVYAVFETSCTTWLGRADNTICSPT